MIINVNSQNNYSFVPDIGDNLSLSENQSFKILVRKLNHSLSSSKWARFRGEGNVEIDLREKLKSHIIKLENPPMLKIDGKQEKELTIDILLSDEYDALFGIVTQLIDFINKLESEGKVETKKY